MMNRLYAQLVMARQAAFLLVPYVVNPFLSVNTTPELSSLSLIIIKLAPDMKDESIELKIREPKNG